MAEERQKEEEASAGDPEKIAQINDDDIYRRVAKTPRGQIYGLGNITDYERAQVVDPTIVASQLQQKVTQLEASQASTLQIMSRLVDEINAQGLNIDFTQLT